MIRNAGAAPEAAGRGGSDCACARAPEGDTSNASAIARAMSRITSGLHPEMCDRRLNQLTSRLSQTRQVAASVNRDGLARHPAGAIGGEKQNQLGDVHRLAGPAERMRLLRAFQK